MSFRFIQITDHHILESETSLQRGFSPAHAFRSTLRHISDHHRDVDFIVSTGDLVHNGTDAEYAVLRSLLGVRDYSPAPGPQRADFGRDHAFPMYFLPGNHDPREAFFRAMFPPPDGSGSADAMNVAFEWKGVRFVCVDWGANDKAVATPAMLDHLERSLRDGMPAIVLSHHHLTPVGMPRIDRLIADDVTGFAACLRNRNVLAVLAGYAHTTYESTIAGVPVLGLRSTTFSFLQDGDEFLGVLRPPHYRVITVGDGRMDSEIVEVPI